MECTKARVVVRGGGTYASSAMRTNLLVLSAVECTATHLMPILLAVCITRHAISPRLATRILSKRGLAAEKRRREARALDCTSARSILGQEQMCNGGQRRGQWAEATCFWGGQGSGA